MSAAVAALAKAHCLGRQLLPVVVHRRSYSLRPWLAPTHPLSHRSHSAAASKLTQLGCTRAQTYSTTWALHHTDRCFWSLLLQVVPILRAGLVLLEQAATLLPASETYHLGYVRDDETLQVGSDVRHHSMIATVMTAFGCHNNCQWMILRLGLHQGG
jgi:hypothetical protein